MKQSIKVSELLNKLLEDKSKIVNNHSSHLLLCSKEMINFQIQALDQHLLHQVGMILTSLLLIISKELLENIELIKGLVFISILLNFNIILSILNQEIWLMLFSINHTISPTLILAYLLISYSEIKFSIEQCHLCLKIIYHGMLKS